MSKHPNYWKSISTKSTNPVVVPATPAHVTITIPTAVEQPIVHKQTTPATQTGRDISSQNSTRHGCCAIETLILPTENLADFTALESAWRKTYNPQDETEHHLVNQLISSDWLFQRSVRTLTQIEAEIFAAEPNPLKWDDTQHKAITRFQRYRTANQNTYTKCRKAVEDYRKNRKNEQHKAEQLTIAQTRLKVYEEKNKPKPTPDQIIEKMRQRAIALGFKPKDS